MTLAVVLAALASSRIIPGSATFNCCSVAAFCSGSNRVCFTIAVLMRLSQPSCRSVSTTAARDHRAAAARLNATLDRGDRDVMQSDLEDQRILLERKRCDGDGGGIDETIHLQPGSARRRPGCDSRLRASASAG